MRDKSSTCSPLGMCLKCSSEDNILAGDDTCSLTGYKQENLCKASESCAGIDCSDSDIHVYLSCHPSAGKADAVMKFETIMFMGAVSALYMVWKRKRAAYQRLSPVVNN